MARGYKVSRGGASEKIILQNKTVYPAESTQIITADPGYTALERVTVEAMPPIPPPALQTKSATPTKQAQKITYDAGWDGLEEVNIAAIPANFIDPADANATAAQVEANRTFYAVNGTRKTGTMPVYTGATTVYPSSYTQTLATAGKKLNSNITIYDVPPPAPDPWYDIYTSGPGTVYVATSSPAGVNTYVITTLPNLTATPMPWSGQPYLLFAAGDYYIWNFQMGDFSIELYNY